MGRLPAISRFVNRHFGDEIVFWKSWLDSPRGVGAVWPTAAGMARRMAELVDPSSGLPVLELGPGTGTVTRAILARGIAAEKLYAIEYSAHFVRLLRQRFAGLKVFNGDAFDLDTALGSENRLVFDSVVCSLPLMNFPARRRQALIEDLLARIPPGRPIVLFTYAMIPPVRPPKSGNIAVRHHHLVLRNVPPANLWIYRRRGDPAALGRAAA